MRTDPTPPPPRKEIMEYARVTRETSDRLAELAALRGQPKSALIREFIDRCLPGALESARAGGSSAGGRKGERP